MSSILATVQRLEAQIKALEDAGNQQPSTNNQVQQRNPTPQQVNNPSTDNTAPMFQSPPRPNNSSNMNPDAGPTPQVSTASLVDYQRGVLKLTNIRILEAYQDSSSTWRYTAVTLNNTVVKDLQRMHMSNIRPLHPAPSQNLRTQSTHEPFSTSPTVRTSQGSLPNAVPPPVTSHSSAMRSTSMHQYPDDMSHASSSTSDPIIMYVGHQYRYPKHSPTISRVNYSYITDKAQKWKLSLASEETMKLLKSQIKIFS